MEQKWNDNENENKKLIKEMKKIYISILYKHKKND